MKLASLLAKFLHEHHRLDLPGIGTFTFNAAALPEEDTRKSRPQEPGNVSFESNAAIKENPELISFISSQTGKIKALAAADLDSHLELAKQFLNIGKPFQFEGIGSLVKNKPGEYSLAATESLFDKVKSIADRENLTAESSADYKSILRPKKEKINWRKPAVALLVLAGVGLAVWGGYTVYKITTSKNKKDNIAKEVKSEQPIDTIAQKTDGNNTGQVSQLTTQQLLPGQYKYVVEVAEKTRALARYNKLGAIGVKEVKMETKDSLTFKIYFVLPSSVSDTARILDSLRRNYTPAGKTAFIDTL